MPNSFIPWVARSVAGRRQRASAIENAEWPGYARFLERLGSMFVIYRGTTIR
jgi:hypothetical protein